MASFAHFLRSQWLFTPPYPKQSFEGQTVIITGSNTGLGREAARHIVRLGAEKVIIACRSAEKGEAARANIEKSTGRTNVIEVWQLDLGSYDSVKEFAKRAEGLPRIDVLLENAGIAKNYWSMIADNESCVTVNVISTMLLGILLLPKLKQVATKYKIRPILSIVNSEVHGYTQLPERKAPGKLFDNLNDEKLSAPYVKERYPVSKLLQVFATRALVDEYASPADQFPVTINLVNPGLCYSELSREQGPMFRFMQIVLGARSTEVGSRTLVWGAAGGPETHGKYMSDCKVAEFGRFVTTEEGVKTQQRTWEELKEKLKKIEPGLFDRL
ncbi:short-chain dehydrogenase [Rhizodiscina lignyota]|uniref:Short-chain dehydrogenase n=1 Tax=Rhizodiscina lignyota TaxID=1504668 RepID=A0A9P4IA60_9PEZI|nr:short-chain dehydrogenase [Rhizodiscina lignyota]